MVTLGNMQSSGLSLKFSQTVTRRILPIMPEKAIAPFPTVRARSDAKTYNQNIAFFYFCGTLIITLFIFV
jgi:hypothetical protein